MHGERTAQRALAEYDDMIRARASNGTNDPLQVRSLPWAPKRRLRLPDIHLLECSTNRFHTAKAADCP